MEFAFYEMSPNCVARDQYALLLLRETEGTKRQQRWGTNIRSLI